MYSGNLTRPSAELETPAPVSLAPAQFAVDLRSDTVTRPTPEMREAMFHAVVGDDVYGEDPTVNLLQSRAAEIFNREAALFVPSGSMGNLIAIMVWTRHGHEVICEERGHIHQFEMGSISAIAGCMPRTTYVDDGILTWELIEPLLRPKSRFAAQTGLAEVHAVSDERHVLSRLAHTTKFSRYDEYWQERGGGTSDGADGVRTVGDVKLMARSVEGIDLKDLRSLADEGKKKVGSGIVAIVGVTDDGKAGIVVGVTDDLVKRFNAVDLVRKGAEVLGGKGGGGRPDMAQAGGPDASKADAALAAIEAALGG